MEMTKKRDEGESRKKGEKENMNKREKEKKQTMVFGIVSCQSVMGLQYSCFIKICQQ